MRFTTLFLFFATIVSGQEEATINTNPNLLNFNKAMAIEQASDSQIDSILALIEAYSISNGDSSLLLGQKAIALTKANPDKRKHAYALLFAGIAHEATGDQAKKCRIGQGS